MASVKEVRDAELLAIWEAQESARQKRGEAPRDREEQRRELTGLAFSGGGIRSATFNLGVLQALARLRLLKKFDYLSTVSGGGYIGSWLSAWVARAEGGVEEVEKKLGADAEPREMGFLREFSNYLTPKLGLMSADTLTGIATWLRNLLLNFTIIVAATAILLLAPWLLGWLGATASAFDLVWISSGFLAVAMIGIAANVIWQEIEEDKLEKGVPPVSPLARPKATNLYLVAGLAGLGLLAWWYWWPEGWLGQPSRVQGQLLMGVLLAVVGFGGALWEGLSAPRMQPADARPQRTRLDPAYVQAGNIGVYVVAPLVLWAGLLALAMQGEPAILDVAIKSKPAFLQGWLKEEPALAAATLGIVIIVCAFGLVVVRALYRYLATFGYREVGRRDPWRRIAGLLAGTALGVALLMPLGEALRSTDGAWHAVVWGIPGMLAVFLLSATVTLGISGRIESEYAREWWSRLGGLVIRIGAAWAVLAAAAVYGPLLVWRLTEWASGLGAAWILTTVTSVLLAKSPASSDKDAPKWIGLITKVGPYVFVAGLLVAVAAALHAAMSSWHGGKATLPAEYFETLFVLSDPAWVLPAGAVLLAVVYILCHTVDINLFSFHMFYRNRLVRCYLGASNPKREPLPFIGFDSQDNPRLTALKKWPYHLINTALNLTSSRRLGWQERKAGSFVLSPLYCGYAFPSVGPSGEPIEPCFQKTAEYVGGHGYLNLGTALTISGAAASPNMGYHSSPAVAFLLTIFNVRLGWWIQNPSRAQTWRSGGPHFGLRYLLSELFGLSNELTPFVYVSDGGHFDNLGLYELVRRRCRFIVVSDAGADPGFQFDDLGNAVRKCKVDLGVDINIRARATVPDPASGRSLYRCAVGTIRYPERDGEPAARGYLLYLKPSLTGDEPSDVLQYAKGSPAFPHEPTADQWFSESQFESYRKLGFHTARSAFHDAGMEDAMDLESVFVALKERWYPPASAGSAAFTKHGAELKRLADQMRAEPKLKFLDRQLYPEWPSLIEGTARPGRPGTETLWLPEDYDELQAGFHFCHGMLHLMENVYCELRLEEEHAHPDNRGWMNLFRHWAWSGMFVATYAVCCSMYGARFQRFCERRLDLRPGRVQVPAPLALAATLARLKFVEQEIVRRLEGAGLPFDQAYLLQAAAWSPAVLERGTPGVSGSLVYTFGFALAHQGRLVYLRVQNHLRTMGFARRALIELRERHGIREFALDTARRIEAADAKWLFEDHDLTAFQRLFASVQMLSKEAAPGRPSPPGGLSGEDESRA